MAWERKLMRTVRVQNDQVVGTLAHLITTIAEQGLARAKYVPYLD